MSQRTATHDPCDSFKIVARVTQWMTHGSLTHDPLWTTACLTVSTSWLHEQTNAWLSRFIGRQHTYTTAYYTLWARKITTLDVSR